MNNQKKEGKTKRNSSKPLTEDAGGSAKYYLAGILAITLIVFLPAIQNLFITFDDMQYVVENQFKFSIFQIEFHQINFLRCFEMKSMRIDDPSFCFGEC